MPRVVLGVGAVCGVVLILLLMGWGASLWEVFSDRERLQRVLEGAGTLAPLLFLVLLAVQAVLAPSPAPALAIGRRRPWRSSGVTGSGFWRASF